MQKIVLITGASKGIGRYLAEYYIQQGYGVVGCSRGAVDFAPEGYEHFCVDITNEIEVKKLLSAIRKKYKRLDILINNAGVNLMIAPVLLVPYETAQKTIETNVLGTFLMCRESVKVMMTASFGRIINFASMAVRHEVVGESIYTASKAAIISFTRVLAKEVSNYGITCNVIAPAAISTDMMNAVDQKALEKVLAQNAIKTHGKMEDVSNTIDWLIKNESAAITGQIIYLGGA